MWPGDAQVASESESLVNTGSGCGLLPDSPKPLLELHNFYDDLNAIGQNMEYFMSCIQTSQESKEIKSRYFLPIKCIFLLFFSKLTAACWYITHVTRNLL